MFRKAAILLALAASFIGTQAMDLPLARELTYNKHNKTKAAKPNKGARSKAKTVEICLYGTSEEDVSITDVEIYTASLRVYNCADINADGTLKSGVTDADAIGDAGLSCISPGGDLLAPCTGIFTLDTDWHKTTKASSIAGTFWTDRDELPDLVTMVAPVVTGTTGAWGKVDSIKSVSLSPIPASSVSAETYKLTISYKGRGWNPAAY